MTTNGDHVTHDSGTDNGLNIYNARSVADIKAALANLHERDQVVTAQLDSLVAAQKDLQRELGRMDLFRATLSTQASKTRSISNGMLSDAASTANRISSSVKRLDLEQERVKATLTVVEQVAELKACVLGVAGSMGAAQDWETAASYLSKASKIPKEVIEGDFAAWIVPTTEVPDAPAVTLDNASESLCTLFLKEFDKAVQENDGGKITRFFKLFPLINRSELGLDVYGRYVCQGVATRARANLNAGTGGNQSKDGFFYAGALTKLFEHIASIIEGHGGLVERHYGAGKMSRVIERLQVEADLQGGIILDTWADERRIDRQLTDIRAYPFTFLVQSFAAPARQVSGTQRSSSPAPARVSEDEGVDMKQVDFLLNEMTAMLNKWSLYTRFITDKCKDPTETTSPDTDSNTIPPFLANAPLSRKIADRLIAPFTTLTTFFFRRSVEKAFQLDEPPANLSLNPHKPFASNPPHITSAIEDIMYIINKILTQTLSTGDATIVTSVTPNLSRVLGSDFIGMEQRKMRDEHYPRAAIPGQLPPEVTIVQFMVLLNNLDVATTYIEQIVNSRLSPSTTTTTPLATLFPNPITHTQITTTLQSLSTIFAENLYKNVTLQRLRPMLSDAFRDADYTLSPAELSEQLAEMGHVPSDNITTENDGAGEDSGNSSSRYFTAHVRQRFALGWDALTKPLARILTESNNDKLMSMTIKRVGELLEKRIWTYAAPPAHQASRSSIDGLPGSQHPTGINALGAQRLEHDINEIIRVVCQGKKWAYREYFEKVRQILMVMNVEAEEWEELEREGEWEGVADKLSSEERVRARGLVTG
ncbi:Conserved oligomeric Golgi complex subunit 4 [Cyphellophora attinorum]|uniref:Conserved oligomeric Golgi complex subunit 4 n=1 Tax=Cyphellophora attinorum TaxID=1664694 RepID=A0A0N1H8U1_9EURO|nr:Conserved oligomeric Golgi complex subunit 4 [Phialophora attinorum]KPI39853.1 Conserved oligomeric Golgi complex subunit 4 [Phialophora attinorum]